MSYIIFAYLLVSAWVFYLKYSDTPEEHKDKVKEHWLKYYIKCLAWPLILCDKAKGF